MKTASSQIILRMVSLAGAAVSILFAVWGFKNGIFTSKQMMEETVVGLGVMGPVLFMMVQAVQVVLPILPGGISCLAGVLLFGAVKGFLYNYIGICIGSILAFSLAKSCGRPLLPKLFGLKLLEKYDSWTENEKRFEKMFALAIFLPVAPDDFLCYLAGTTAMSWKKFVSVILMGKPFAILLYSLILNTAWNRFLFWAG